MKTTAVIVNDDVVLILSYGIRIVAAFVSWWWQSKIFNAPFKKGKIPNKHDLLANNCGEKKNAHSCSFYIADLNLL